MNELIELIIKGDDPIRVIQAARKVTNTIVPELAHLRGYIAGMSDSWARDNREQAIKEFRWELGYILMQMAYGEQLFSITPMERVK